MSEFLMITAILIVWLVLNAWVLPYFGVHT
jgi:hypothetical protein